jgi:glutathione S-transferase
MPLTLYFHPLSSYCQKALIGLYENGTPFTPQCVDFSNAEQEAAFRQMWPVRKFPVLRDGETLVPESTGIIEYLAWKFPGPVKLIPDDPAAAFAVREQDRFFDLHVHAPMQKIIGDRIRPADKKDPFGLAEAHEALKTALGLVEKRMAESTWAAGSTFSMADCAAAAPLFYVNLVVMPLAETYRHVAAYLDRLIKRPSFARALEEAKPFLQYVPR